MNEFTVESFMKTLDEDKTIRNGKSGDKIAKLLMNTKDNQGTIMFIPFLNKKNNNFYLKIGNKLSKVKEWKGHTSKFEGGQVWYKILPEEYYENLSKENQDLLAEINGLLESISKYKVHDFNTLRNRDYSLFYGVLLRHTGVNGNVITANINKPCLFIFPSHSPINAIDTAIAAKKVAMGGSISWITDILSPNNTGRDGALVLSFKRSISSLGYESTVTFEFNSPKNPIVDPSAMFDDSVTKFFNDPIRDLLGWQGDGESGYFNTDIMRDLRDDLRIEINKILSDKKAIPEQVYENKNGQQDPMKVMSQTPVTPVTTVTSNDDLSDLPF